MRENHSIAANTAALGRCRPPLGKARGQSLRQWLSRSVTFWSVEYGFHAMFCAFISGVLRAAILTTWLIQYFSVVRPTGVGHWKKFPASLPNRPLSVSSTTHRLHPFYFLIRSFLQGKRKIKLEEFSLCGWCVGR